MQDKMERLLNQIGMNKDYLENASIDKIIVYEKNNLWEFIISNDKVLDRKSTRLNSSHL